MGTRDSATFRIMGSWIWALPFLLIAAALTFFQTEAFPPTVDEFVSMLDSGWLNGGYSPPEIVLSLMQHSPSHMPGYYFMLGGWGSLAAYDIAVARILSVMLYLLILALAYRLARDFIAPFAGAFALLIVMSGTFFNFYIAHARPYTLFLLLSCLTLWLYLRAISQRAEPTTKDYVSLCTTVFALVMTHLFSATLLLTIGLFHLLFAPKKRRWLKVALAIATGVMICLPMIGLVLEGYETAIGHLGYEGPNSIEAASLWLSMMLNNQPVPLLLIAGAGIFVGVRQGYGQAKSLVLLLMLFVISLALASDIASLVRPQTMRHQLDGWMILVLVACAGHYALFRWKPWLIILLVLWIPAGIHYQRSTQWWTYIDVRAPVFVQPPFHALSRLAASAHPTPYLIGYPYDEFLSYALESYGPPGAVRRDLTQGGFYFGRHGISLAVTEEQGEFVDSVRRGALHSPSLWHFHMRSADAQDLALAAATLSEFDYSWCGATSIGLDTVIDQYIWDPFDCKPVSDPAVFQTEIINYELYKAGLNLDGDTLMFIDRWTPRQEVDKRNYNMSYQLIDQDWNNLAQLNLPLVDEGQLRRFSLDVSQVTPGVYRPMLIVHNPSTGERLTWEGNPGYVPEMLELGEITIASS